MKDEVVGMEAGAIGSKKRRIEHERERREGMPIAVVGVRPRPNESFPREPFFYLGVISDVDDVIPV